MKKLYTFTLNKEIEIEKPEKSVDAQGTEITILKKVKENQPRTFFVAKPTRAQLEEGELFYASKVSEYIKAGILSASLLQRRVIDDGGILNEKDKRKYEDLYGQLFEKQAIHRNLLAKPDQTEEDKNAITKAFNEMVDILTKIQNVETQVSNNLYQNTAENLARNKTTLFYTLILSHEEKDEKEIPVFGKGSYADKLNQYDKLEESEDKFNLELLGRLFLVTSLWQLGKAETQEDFDVLIKLYDNQNVINALVAPDQEENKQTELKLESK